jgi:SulP family sulfate permease
MKLRREGTAVDLAGMNLASATIVDRLAVYDKPNALELMLKH